MASDANLTADPPNQFVVHEVSPSYWKVTFENGPVNLIDPDTVEQLCRLVTRIEESPTVTVVVSTAPIPTTSWRTGT